VVFSGLLGGFEEPCTPKSQVGKSLMVLGKLFKATRGSDERRGGRCLRRRVRFPTVTEKKETPIDQEHLKTTSVRKTYCAVWESRPEIGY